MVVNRKHEISGAYGCFGMLIDTNSARRAPLQMFDKAGWPRLIVPLGNSINLARFHFRVMRTRHLTLVRI